MSKFIVDYPEICHDIVALLSRQDLIACLRVIHAFHQTFCPYIWQSVTIVRPFDLYFDALPDLGLPEWASLSQRTPHDPYEFYKDNDYNPENPSDVPKGPSFASLEKYGHLIKRACIHYDEKRVFLSENDYFCSSMDRNKPEKPLCGLAQGAICAAILVLCSALKTLEIRVIDGGGRYRPYYGGCGQAWVGYKKKKAAIRKKDSALARLIELLAPPSDPVSKSPQRNEGRAGLDGFLIRGSLSFGPTLHPRVASAPR